MLTSGRAFVLASFAAATCHAAIYVSLVHASGPVLPGALNRVVFWWWQGALLLLSSALLHRERSPARVAAASLAAVAAPYVALLGGFWVETLAIGWAPKAALGHELEALIYLVSQAPDGKLLCQVVTGLCFVLALTAMRDRAHRPFVVSAVTGSTALVASSVLPMSEALSRFSLPLCWLVFSFTASMADGKGFQSSNEPIQPEGFQNSDEPIRPV